jgi:hypothetical protein
VSVIVFIPWRVWIVPNLLPNTLLWILCVSSGNCGETKSFATGKGLPARSVMLGYTTIYGDYVRTPPSLSAYPKADMIETALTEVLKRMRVDLKEWRQQGGRIVVTVTSGREIDERNTRYLDRSDTFDDAKVEEKSADQYSLVGDFGGFQSFIIEAIVNESISGKRLPVSSKVFSTANKAALELSESKTVSTSKRSTPPSIRPRVWSW